MRCTQATLESLGIYGECPLDGLGVIERLSVRYNYKALGGYLWGNRWTVQHFCKDHPTGRYYLTTEGHAMALVDGMLTDTTGLGKNKRHILMAFELIEKSKS